MREPGHAKFFFVIACFSIFARIGSTQQPGAYGIPAHDDLVECHGERSSEATAPKSPVLEYWMAGAPWRMRDIESLSPRGPELHASGYVFFLSFKVSFVYSGGRFHAWDEAFMNYARRGPAPYGAVDIGLPIKGAGNNSLRQLILQELTYLSETIAAEFLKD